MNDIDHENTEDIVCPYCGYEFTDSWEFSDSDDCIECHECEKKFSMDSDTTRSFSTHKLCSENGVEHEWVESEHVFYSRKYKQCRVCGKWESLSDAKDEAK